MVIIIKRKIGALFHKKKREIVGEMALVTKRPPKNMDEGKRGGE